jgi:DNA-binding GntR family transcriptional regulator
LDQQPSAKGVKPIMPKLGANHENLDTKLYNRLKTMILERKLTPGEKIYQDKLAQDFGVSRTPLVNALKYLEHEKLINSIPRRGYFVRKFTNVEMIHIFEVREVLEGLAARRASIDITDAQIKRLNDFFKNFKDPKHLNDYKAYSREDRRFHNFVIDIGSREFLKSILNTYNVLAFSYQVDASEGLVRPPSETLKEHQAIIKAISNRDPIQAENNMRIHLRKSLEQLKKELAESEEK